jgi:hypothetical protein
LIDSEIIAGRFEAISGAALHIGNIVHSYWRPAEADECFASVFQTSVIMGAHIFSHIF